MQLKHLIAAGLAPAAISARALGRRSIDCGYHDTVPSGGTCQTLLNTWQLSLDELTKLNPGITCPNLDTSKEYCVIGSYIDDGPATTSKSSTTTSTSTSTSTSTNTIKTSTTTTFSSTTTTKTSTTSKPSTTTTSSSTSTTKTSTTTSKSTTTTTTAGNGVTTPTPTQSGMVGNCNKFHFVQSGQTCDVIAALYSLSAAQFVQWNPAVKSDCTGLWASTYACVGIIGGGTPTAGPNGIVTPTPTQSGMVNVCNKFVKVNTGDTCDTIASKNGPIATEDFVLWNAGVGGTACKSLQAGTYACVGLTPSGTIKGTNGIATPLPTAAGMVRTCNKFVKVNSGDTCDLISSKNGPISTANFLLWNTGVGGTACKSLQAGTYACVGVTGTQTTPSVATPTPTQPGMVSNCNKFIKINSGDTCDTIASKNGVTSQNVKKWNGQSDACNGLWANTYACIGVIA